MQRNSLARISTVLALVLLTAGCKPSTAPPRGETTFVCREFGFPIEKRDWLEVREIAGELSQKISVEHEFSDTSHKDPVDRRIIGVTMRFDKNGYKFVLGGYIDSDLQPVRFFVFENAAVDSSRPCVKWREADYEMAKSMFSRKWPITKEITKPYDLYKQNERFEK